MLSNSFLLFSSNSPKLRILLGVYAKPLFEERSEALMMSTETLED